MTAAATENPGSTSPQPRAGGERSAGRHPIVWLVAVVFALSVPLFLITTNVLQVTNDLAFYEQEFARYRVEGVTGLSAPQLRGVALAFIDFFAGRRDALDLQVEVQGSRRPLFNQRELDHMEDVFHLMQGVKATQALSGLAVVGLSVLGFVLERRRFLRTFGRLCLLSGGLTLALLLCLAGLALVDFGDAFVQFHLIAFSNDLWILDPTRDYLLMLFPEGFWFDATMRIATLTALEAAALVILGVVMLRWTPSR